MEGLNQKSPAEDPLILVFHVLKEGERIVVCEYLDDFGAGMEITLETL